MKREMEEMLRELIVRDFSPMKIIDVMSPLSSVIMNKEMIKAYDRTDDTIMVMHYQSYLQKSIDEAKEMLKTYMLNYEVEDLV